MKHLVTGGSGFLGNLIARRLYDRGESVKILDIWEDPTRPPEIEFIHCDIRDRAGVAEAMRGVDIVHHIAALNPLTKAGKKFWEVNVEGSRIVAEEAVNSGVSSFIHMSSSAVFGGVKASPITSETPPQPIEIYGKAKLAGELLVDEICEKAGLPIITLRPRAIIGESRLGIFKILFEWIQEGRNIYVIGDGNQQFQFIHPIDLMDAYMLALDLGKPGTYNVGTNKYGSLREGLENLIAYAGTDSKVKGLPTSLTITTLTILDQLGLSPLAPFHYLTYHKEIYFDVTPLVKLGWQPKYSNDDMLRESYDWFTYNKENLALEKSESVHRRPAQEKLLWLVRQLS